MATGISTDEIILVLAGLVSASVLSSLLGTRYGAPLLLIFLLVGMVASAVLGLSSPDPHIAYLIGNAALAIILFDSGFHTRLKTFRIAALPALSLATLGIGVTTAVVAVPAHWLLSLDWVRSFLMGAILASTDAAAVFFLLRVGGITVRDRVRSLLEVESGCNDPMAIFLTLTLSGLTAAGAAPSWLNILSTFVIQFGVAVPAGLAGGGLLVLAVNRLPIERSLLPILVLALVLVLFALVALAGGSGYLAVYIAGLLAGNARLSIPDTLRRFQDGMSWLAQILMFLTLGLLATPANFPVLIPAALAIAVVLTVVARPLGVWLSLLPFRTTSNEIAFVSWVGLRGAVSILLGIVPMLSNPDDSVFFDVAFLVVLVSLAAQGWTIGPVARWLGLIVPPRLGPVQRWELEIPGARHALVSYRIVAGSLVSGGHRLPLWAQPSLVVRDGRSLLAHLAGPLEAGDLVWLFARPDRIPHLDRLFASTARAAEADHHFFGDFPLSAQATMDSLAATYDLPLPKQSGNLTVGQYLERALKGRPAIGDRIAVNDIELIVRAVTDDDRIAEIGLATEPTRIDTPRLPLFLSGNELKTRCRSLFQKKGIDTPSP